MTENQATHISASFSKAHNISLIILERLQEEGDIPVGYALLGCALTMARLLNPTTRLSDEEEIKFAEDVMAFGGAYWGDNGTGGGN